MSKKALLNKAKQHRWTDNDFERTLKVLNDERSVNSVNITNDVASSTNHSYGYSNMTIEFASSKYYGAKQLPSTPFNYSNPPVYVYGNSYHDVNGTPNYGAKQLPSTPFNYSNPPVYGNSYHNVNGTPNHSANEPDYYNAYGTKGDSTNQFYKYSYDVSGTENHSANQPSYYNVIGIAEDSTSQPYSHNVNQISGPHNVNETATSSILDVNNVQLDKVNDAVKSAAVPLTSIVTDSNNDNLDSLPYAKSPIHNHLNDVLQNDENQCTVPSDHDVESKENKPSKKKKPRKPWIEISQFLIDQNIWNSFIAVDKSLDSSYIDYFIDILNENFTDDIPCVLKSNGWYPRGNLHSLRFQCKHKCAREYKVHQIEDNQFAVFHNSTEISFDPITEVKRTRPIRGYKREILKEKLKTMFPRDYTELAQKNINKKLYNLGNLQEHKSEGTLDKVRHEALQINDFDKDDIIDLLKMKILQDKKLDSKKSENNSCALENDETKDINYIRRISLDPYMVILISDEQFDCLALIADKLGDDVTIYFDATGGCVKKTSKKVLYYCGATPDQVKSTTENEKRKARVLPLIQFISNAHDAFNISIALREYKNEFHKRFPRREFPIKHAVTDFSYAMINALCHAWNSMPLISYINHTYDAANGDVTLDDLRSLFLIIVFIHLCCSHLMKTFSNDISTHFSISQENEKIMKEIFAGMINIDNLQVLREVWISLSTILLCKFINNKVETALVLLAKIMVKEEELKDEDSDSDTDTDDVHPEDTLPIVDEHEAIYKQSKFYRNFTDLTFKEEFCKQEGHANPFYNPQFADLFLKKYISILSLWTCLTQSVRKSNAYIENHFKWSKSTMNQKAITLGTPPWKAGRFVRFLEEQSRSTTNAILLNIPRGRCCGNKRKQNEAIDEPPGKKQKTETTPKRAPNTILSLYQSAPTKSVTRPKSSKTSDKTANSHQTPITPQRTTSTSTPTNYSKIKRSLELELDLIKIDDPLVEEQWTKRVKAKKTYFNKETLQKINERPSQLKRILETKPTKQRNQKKRNIMSAAHLSNGLIDNPNTYLNVVRNYVVATFGKLKMQQNDYMKLVAPTWFSNHLISYIFAMFAETHKTVQFEAYKAHMLISESSSKLPLLKIQKEILIAVHIINGIHFTLIIVDCKDKTFTYVDPIKEEDSSTLLYFQNFLHFVVHHNSKYPKFKLPADGWQLKNLQHQLQTDGSNCGPFVVHFAQQYAKDQKIDATFDPLHYRIELQHLILRKSTNMKRKCIVCGSISLPKIDEKETELMAECDKCRRWTHFTCSKENEDSLKDESVNYFCIICSSNTPEKLAQIEFKESIDIGEMLNNINNNTDVPETITRNRISRK